MGNTRARVVLAAFVIIGIALVLFVRRPPTDDTRADAGAYADPHAVPWGNAAPSEVANGGIEGVVRKPDGALLEGAIVALEAFSNAHEQRSAATVVTGADGSFRFRTLPEGKYRVTATTRGLRAALTEPIELAQGETRRGIELRLETGGVTLSGHVLDSGGGPIVGARVTASRDGLFETVSGARGEYSLTLKPESYTLAASAEGYAAHTADEYKAIDADTVVDFLLHPGATVHGQVLHGTEPVPNAEVRLSESDGRYFSPWQETTTNEQGEFDFRGVDPGAYRLLARKGNLVGRSKVVELEIAGLASVTLGIAEGVAVSGRIVDAAGAPVPKANLELTEGRVAKWVAVTTESGAYRVEGLPAGELRLSVKAAGFAELDADVFVRPPQVQRDFELTRAGTLDGAVVDAAGRAVAGVEVNAMPKETYAFNHATSDAAGRWSFTGLPPDTYEVTASSGGQVATAKVVLALGEKRAISMQLEAGGEVSGKVTYQDGTPAVGAYVRVMGIGSGKADATIGSDGTYAIRDLPLGPTSLVVSRMKRRRLTMEDRTSKRVVIARGAPKVVDFVLEKAGLAIRGVVVNADGSPAPRIAVLQDYACGYARRSPFGEDLTTDLEGRFVIEDVAAGRPRDICAAPPGLPVVVARAVQPGTSDVRLQLQRGASLAGVVVHKDGKPAADFSVRAESKEEGVADVVEQSFDPRGAFEVRGLGPGAYRLYVRTEDGLIGNLADVTLAEGEEKRELRIILGAGAAVRGRLIGESGTALRGASVEAQTGKTFTDADGAFVLRGLSAGDVRLMATPGRWRSNVRNVTLGDAAEVDIGTWRIVTRDAGSGLVGLQITQREGRIFIAKVLPGLPAEAAGLHEGEEVVAIDGIRATELSETAAFTLIRGEPGASVKLEIGPNPGGAARTVVVVRAKDKNKNDDDD